MDVDKLLKALDDDNNTYFLDLTSEKIKHIKIDILKELFTSRKQLIEILKKLQDYRYVDGMNELTYGTYIRWIPISDPKHLELKKGAIFCEFKVTDNGVFVVCKNYGYNSRYFQFKMEENLVFQRLTDPEKVLLSALDHLAK
jgi:hypothetical protein